MRFPPFLESVCRTTRFISRLAKDPVQKVDLIPPILVWSHLSLWEEEALSGIETSPHVGKTAILSRNLDDAVQSKQVECGPTRLENDKVGCDKQRRFAIVSGASYKPSLAITRLDNPTHDNR